MQKTFFLFALSIFLATGLSAQVNPDNRTPEKKAQDERELNAFKKQYPQLFRYNTWPIRLTDGSLYVGGFTSGLILKGVHIVDSLHSNFHADMPDTSTVIPYVNIPVGGSRAQVILTQGMGPMSIWGDANITPLDSEAMARDTNFTQMARKNANFMQAPLFDHSVRVSLNGTVVVNWTPLAQFPHRITKFYQVVNTVKLKDGSFASMYSYGYTYQLYDTTLALHDQLLIEVKNDKNNWMLDRFNINRMSSTPDVSALVIPSDNDDGHSGQAVAPKSREKKTFGSTLTSRNSF